MKTLILSFCALCVSGLAGFGSVSPEEISDLKYRANKGETAALVALAERCERGEGVPADKTAALCYYLVALKNEPENKNLQQRITSLGGAKFLPGAPGRGVSGEKHVVDLGNGIKIALIKIPAGTFMMGSPKSEQEYFSDEKQTEVKLTEPFALAETEITQAQWCAVMGKNPSFHQGENFPVECVTWHETLAFCRELTRRERASGKLPRGMKFSLPTEAQWEFACRAGTQTRFSFGDFADEISSYGNAASGSETKACAVKSFRPNSWGFLICTGTSPNGVWTRIRAGFPAAKILCRNPALRAKFIAAGAVIPCRMIAVRQIARDFRQRQKNRYLGFRVALVKE